MDAGKVLRGGILAGVAVGVGAAVVGPALWRLARPLAKDAIKAGIAGYDAARLALARASEEMEDIAAEAAQELSEAAAKATEAAKTAAATVKGDGEVITHD